MYPLPPMQESSRASGRFSNTAQALATTPWTASAALSGWQSFGQPGSSSANKNIELPVWQSVGGKGSKEKAELNAGQDLLVLSGLQQAYSQSASPSSGQALSELKGSLKEKPEHALSRNKQVRPKDAMTTSLNSLRLVKTVFGGVLGGVLQALIFKASPLLTIPLDVATGLFETMLAKRILSGRERWSQNLIEQVYTQRQGKYISYNNMSDEERRRCLIPISMGVTAFGSAVVVVVNQYHKKWSKLLPKAFQEFINEKHFKLLHNPVISRAIKFLSFKTSLGRWGLKDQVGKEVNMTRIGKLIHRLRHRVTNSHVAILKQHIYSKWYYLLPYALAVGAIFGLAEGLLADKMVTRKKEVVSLKS